MPALTTDETVFYEVATADVPQPNPFLVVRIDTAIQVEDGCLGTVVSTHPTREEAEKEATRLSGRLN